MIQRATVSDYKRFGEKIVEWTLHPEARPPTIDAMREALRGFVEIPERFRQLAYVESKLDTLIVKLPTREMVTESLERFANENEPYSTPLFYYDKICQDGAGMKNLDFLYSRIADYTIAQCM